VSRRSASLEIANPCPSSSGVLWGDLFPCDSDAIERAMNELFGRLRLVRICEVGVWKGQTAVGFNEVCRRAGVPCEYLGIDPTPLETPEFDGFSYLRQASQDCDLSGREFDLVFIDADHSYESVLRDGSKFSGAVSPGGFLVLHDTNPYCNEPNHPNFGVRRALSELNLEGSGFELAWESVPHGWGGVVVYRRRQDEG